MLTPKRTAPVPMIAQLNRYAVLMVAVLLLMSNVTVGMHATKERYAALTISPVWPTTLTAPVTTPAFHQCSAALMNLAMARKPNAPAQMPAHLVKFVVQMA